MAPVSSPLFVRVSQVVRETKRTRGGIPATATVLFHFIEVGAEDDRPPFLHDRCRMCDAMTRIRYKRDEALTDSV